jgi:predicted kinase
MAKLFLLHGYIGSGKTTFAKALAEKENAILFSVDEWVRQLYGWNPQEITFEEMNRRVKELIWHMAYGVKAFGSWCQCRA